MSYIISLETVQKLFDKPPSNKVEIPHNVIPVYRGQQGPAESIARVHAFMEKSGIDRNRLNFADPEGRRNVSVRDMTELDPFKFGLRYARYAMAVVPETRWALKGMAMDTRLEWFRTALMKESMAMLADIKI